jgi:5'-nucleotidase
MYNRRDFIKTVLAGSAFLALPVSLKALSGKKTIELVILHTSDTHAHLDVLPSDDNHYPNLGGIARRATLINKIRSENENVLLLDSGDVFQGTPYFNVYGGKILFELMNLLKYDACTLGNHEFDNGIDWLAEMLQYPNCPFVNWNLDTSDTALKGKLKKWIIIEKGNLKIGVTGLGINPHSLITEANHKGLIYNDPVTEGEAVAKMLKEKMNCNFIIVLSHLGLEMGNAIDDKKLAAKTRNIDLILGGHTHTFLDEPIIINNLDNKPVVIQHSGTAGVRMTRLNFTFYKDKYEVKNNNYV